MDDGDRIVPLPARRRARDTGCPICGQPVERRYRPFCSARCHDVDLARWLKGTYRIETQEKPESPPPVEEEER